jgi:hypothetical protein
MAGQCGPACKAAMAPHDLEFQQPLALRKFHARLKSAQAQVEKAPGSGDERVSFAG